MTPVEDDLDDDLPISRRAFTRELKLAGITYTQLYTPMDEPEGGNGSRFTWLLKT